VDVEYNFGVAQIQFFIIPLCTSVVYTEDIPFHFIFIRQVHLVLLLVYMLELIRIVVCIVVVQCVSHIRIVIYLYNALSRGIKN